MMILIVFYTTLDNYFFCVCPASVHIKACLKYTLLYIIEVSYHLSVLHGI